MNQIKQTRYINYPNNTSSFVKKKEKEKQTVCSIFAVIFNSYAKTKHKEIYKKVLLYFQTTIQKMHAQFQLPIEIKLKYNGDKSKMTLSKRFFSIFW